MHGETVRVMALRMGHFNVSQFVMFQGDYENANVMPTTVVGSAAFDGLVYAKARYVVPPLLV